MAKHVVPHGEGALALLAVDPGQVCGRVLQVGFLVVQDDASLNLALKFLKTFCFTSVPHDTRRPSALGNCT